MVLLSFSLCFPMFSSSRYFYSPASMFPLWSLTMVELLLKVVLLALAVADWGAEGGWWFFILFFPYPLFLPSLLFFLLFSILFWFLLCFCWWWSCYRQWLMAVLVAMMRKASGGNSSFFYYVFSFFLSLYLKTIPLCFSIFPLFFSLFFCSLRFSSVPLYSPPLVDLFRLVFIRRKGGERGLLPLSSHDTGIGWPGGPQVAVSGLLARLVPSTFSSYGRSLVMDWASRDLCQVCFQVLGKRVSREM